MHKDLCTLSLSANILQTLDFPNEFLNLQRLDLATCGLQELPANFGIMVPNVRTLNINFNAIKDLRPLLNVRRLTELHAAGNRLSRLRRNLAVLAKLTTLAHIDLRDNPFTVGYYPAAIEQRIVAMQQLSADNVEISEPHTLPDQDPEAERQYAARLDEDTKLRRRVYEMMLATCCRNLTHLDGLDFASNDVLIKDDIWDRLVLLGVLKKSADRDLGAGED